MERGEQKQREMSKSKTERKDERKRIEFMKFICTTDNCKHFYRDK